ncbi:MAG: glycosyl hydrolase family 28-related protein [Verrucomicrobiota bacterium]
MTIRVLVLTLLAGVTSVRAASFYTGRPNDALAVYLTAENFAVHGDGKGDDSDALQQAVDRVQETTRRGIVFVPEGRYRLEKTIHVWEGIRLIGYGKNRPMFVLGENTPGFQEIKKYDPDVEGSGNYLIHFCGRRPLRNEPIHDASPGTFYSGMSNIDVEIGAGNPAAIGVRFHVAQHCFIAHADFHTGSGKAGVEDVGNEMEDCRFFGGEYGITTCKTSPSWPFLLIDSYFESQRTAAIDTEEAGLTIVRNHFKNVPSVVAVRPDRDEELWIKDSRFEDVSGPAVVISGEANARSQTNLQNVVCERVAVLVSFRDSGKKIAGPGAVYEVRDFCHGLQIAPSGGNPEIRTSCDLAKLDSVPAFIPSDIPSLPDQNFWGNLIACGAAGDGVTDDTAVLQEAISKYRTIYLPSGRYCVKETITLRPDTVLVGLSPVTTQIVLADGALGFEGEAPPKPLLVAPKGGSNILTGIGIDTGSNPGAFGVKWMAGKNSLVNDVRFLGGHGTFKPDGNRVPVYNNNRTGDPDEKRRWDSQYSSLWVTDGGGGTFKDIWTPNTFAQAGLCVSETKTEGRMYAISIEHHVRNEVKLRNISNWQFFAMQLEEERGEGPRVLPVSIDNCDSLLFANLFLYRVSIDSASPCGVRIKSSTDIVFRGVHAYSPGKTTHDNTVFDETTGEEIRSREIARLTIDAQAPVKSGEDSASSVLAPGAKVEKCIGGFDFIDGACADAAGNIYFIDGRWHRIYRWNPETRDLTLLRDSPIDPLALAFDRAGNLMVVSRTGMVYIFQPDGAEDAITVLEPKPTTRRPGAVPLFAVNRWRDEHDFLTNATGAKLYHYVSPDGSAFIPTDDEFRSARRNKKFEAADLLRPDSSDPARQGPSQRKIRQSTVGLLRAYQLTAGKPGQPLYLSDEFAQKTWSFSVDASGNLSAPKLFAEEGEAGVAVDAEGNVYIAAGDIFVFDSSGKKIDVIKVPERPSSLVFGGRDGKTLFITARSGLYAVMTKYGGR